MSFHLVEYLKTSPVIALVGATNNSSKFGNIIFRDLIDKGYTVIPVNPRAKTVEGHTAYHTLTDAAKQHSIGLVNYVVPPVITHQILEEAKSLGILKAWIQPGAGDSTTRDYLDRNGFEYLINACIMVQAPA